MATAGDQRKTYLALVFDWLGASFSFFKTTAAIPIKDSQVEDPLTSLFYREAERGDYNELLAIWRGPKVR